MAYVPVPRDLSKIKNKVALNLTKRQLISFTIAGFISFPTYWFTRDIVGNDIAVILLMITAFPPFFCGVYEKDGIPAEKWFYYYIRQKVLYPQIRIYKMKSASKKSPVMVAKRKVDKN